MNRYTLEEFVQNTQQEDKGEGVFELETPRLLEINLTDTIWAKTGAMVSYRAKSNLNVRACLNMVSQRCSKKCCQEKALPS